MPICFLPIQRGIAPNSLFRAILEAYRDELRVTDLKIATFVCVAPIEALTHNVALL